MMHGSLLFLAGVIAVDHVQGHRIRFWNAGADPTAWFVQYAVIGANTFEAPPISDPSWGVAEHWAVNDADADEGSHMTVLNLADAFGIPPASQPTREEIADAFQVETALGDSAGKSGAELAVSKDKRYIAKRIKKIEVRYVHKLAAKLRESQADMPTDTLLVPIYYMFQRCYTGSAESEDEEFIRLHKPSSKGAWRDCQAWMVSPFLNTPNASQEFDVKGKQGSSLHGQYWGGEDEQLIEAYPRGLALAQNDFSKYMTALNNTVRILSQLHISDYSMLVKVSTGEGQCTGSRDAQVYEVQDPHQPRVSKCIAIGVIDYLGDPAQKIKRWVGVASRKSETYGTNFMHALGARPCEGYIHGPCNSTTD